MATTNDLSNKRVAVLCTNGFEQSELDEPVKALKEAGATVDIVSKHAGEIRGWDGENWSKTTVNVDKHFDNCAADQYDALVLPGGVANPDSMRTEERAIEFTRHFFEAGKPVAAICHGPQLLIECDVLQGRRLTSYPSIKTDLKNAGARWEDQEVVCDQGLVTSRTPKDLPAFCSKMIEEIREGEHAAQKTA
jgi:protease I